MCFGRAEAVIGREANQQERPDRAEWSDRATSFIAVSLSPGWIDFNPRPLGNRRLGKRSRSDGPKWAKRIELLIKGLEQFLIEKD